MSLTREESRLMEMLMESGSGASYYMVQSAVDLAVDSLHQSGVRCAGDDRRAALEAAVIRYILDCGMQENI